MFTVTFDQSTYILPFWSLGLLTVWSLHSSFNVLRNNHMGSPLASVLSPGSYMVSLLPHSISGNCHKFLPDSKEICYLVQVARFWKSTWDQESCHAILGKYNLPQMVGQ